MEEQMKQSEETILEVKDLSVFFSVHKKWLAAVDSVSFSVAPGEITGIVGESGSGKSVMSQSILRLRDHDTVVKYNGEILFEREDLLKKTLSDMQKIRGNQISIIFQDPLNSLSPVHTIGEQLSEILMLHKKMGKQQAGKRAVQMLELTGIPGAEACMKKYPFELSGGQKRRVAIAGVLAMEPEVLILDEPTAGLDPKGRDEILDQIAYLHDRRKITVILVSHSMEDIAKYAERLIVVNDGEIAYDDAPKAVFAHYRELEAMGLAAPQITYIMHALKEKGLDVDVTATTVDEAKENILAVLRKCNLGKLSGNRQSVSDSQSKKENAKAETLISEMEADLTEDGMKESHSDVPDEDLSIQKETMDKKSAEQEENEGGQEV